MVRRCLDIVSATVGLAVSAPVMAAAAIAVRVHDGGPAFYRQERIGKNGKPFMMIKLRTMSVGAEHHGSGIVVSVGDERITRPGRILRATSLDELPQLWNVLRGEMAIIGPRPTVASQVALYSRLQRRRLEVLPGITGWAQVNGRNALSWAERIAFDVWYVEHQTPVLDLWVLSLTPSALRAKKDSLYGTDGKTPDFTTTGGN